jgi:large subunit ribosomal protein L13
MKTVFPSLPSIERDWHVIDADGAVLGRLASQAAFILMGKTSLVIRRSWTPAIT